MASSRHAIIAGAGIGGLTAALTLARAGLTVTLLEQAPALAEAGAGLQLAPNASGILNQFGILDRLVGLALAPERLRVRSQRSGADIMRMPLGPVAEHRWGAPTLVVHRGDLQRALLDRVAEESGIELRTGASVAGFANSPQGVSVAVKSGTDVQSLEADLLIGADGLHSRVRKGLGLGLADQPHYSGRTAWRALVDGRDAPDFALRLETTLWLGSHAHLVHYPLRQGAMVNVVAITDDPWRGVEDTKFWSQSGEGAQLTRRFSGWHTDARQLLASVRDWQRWPLFDRTPASRWSVGRVALLGDAAHPMLPFFAQGAAQAIEDAAALGAAFTTQSTGGRPDVQTALAAYEAKRVARAGQVQLASRRQGTIYHLPGPAALIRDLGMRSLSVENMMSRFDWLYRYGA